MALTHAHRANLIIKPTMNVVAPIDVQLMCLKFLNLLVHTIDKALQSIGKKCKYSGLIFRRLAM